LNVADNGHTGSESSVLSAQREIATDDVKDPELRLPARSKSTELICNLRHIETAMANERGETFPLLEEISDDGKVMEKHRDTMRFSGLC
jgi:hypothetical protein